MEPLSSPNDFQMVPCSKSSYIPLAPTGARSPGQTLPPQAHGHPGGGSVLGRQLPPPALCSKAGCAGKQLRSHMGRVFRHFF